MFTWLNKQGVRSDLGFEVQFTGRFDVEYREGNKIVEIYAESGISGGLPCISINSNAFRRWKDGESIAESQQQRLLENFRKAIEFQGLILIVDHA